MDNHHCRFCGEKLKHTLIDLGLSPISTEYLSESDVSHGEWLFPLRVNVCGNCFLAQAEVYQMPANIFKKYAYFSSYSAGWLKHCKDYVDMIVPRLGLTPKSRVLEIASNDGYLLQYFSPYQIPVLGIEPAENIAVVARQKGIETRSCFFDCDMAQQIKEENGTYDLVIGNNVLAHVPDISGFVSGLSIVLAPTGTITMEFPHLLELLKNTQFDTIYHEHFSYLSLLSVQTIFQKHGLDIYDVETLVTHGGSLRIYAGHAEFANNHRKDSVDILKKQELDFGMDRMQTYQDFARNALKIKLDTLSLISEIKAEGKHIAAFGAAAKGNTFLNYCGIKQDVVDYIVDDTPYKQGLYLPGSLIPIVEFDMLRQSQPDYLLVLPWNWSEEIIEKTKFIREWGCKYILCIPQVRVIE